jgi:hypothetical protein
MWTCKLSGSKWNEYAGKGMLKSISRCVNANANAKARQPELFKLLHQRLIVDPSWKTDT